MSKRVWTSPKTEAFTFSNVSVTFKPILNIRRQEVVAYEALIDRPRGQSTKPIRAVRPWKEQVIYDRLSLCHGLQLAAEHRDEWSGSKLLFTIHPDSESAKQGAHYVMDLAQRFQIDPRRLSVRLATQRGFTRKSLAAFINSTREAGMGIVLRNVEDLCHGELKNEGAGNEVLKLEQDFWAGVDINLRKQQLVSGVTSLCRAMGVLVYAAGVSTSAEFLTLSILGVNIMQGPLLSKPGKGPFMNAVYPREGVNMRLAG